MSAYGAVGDQPGQGCLALPCAVADFAGGHVHRREQIHHSPAQYYYDYRYVPNVTHLRLQLHTTIPFPTETNRSPTDPAYLPYIAFNYLGQLTTDGVDMSGAGRIHPARARQRGLDAGPEQGAAIDSPDVPEMPPGNSTNFPTTSSTLTG